MSQIESPRIVTREEWIRARKAHLRDEKALTRMRDLIARQRREQSAGRSSLHVRSDLECGLPELFAGGGPVLLQLPNHRGSEILQRRAARPQRILQGRARGLFHTYSSYARGNEEVIGAFVYLDITPKGRNERESMDWVRRHHEYDASPADTACHPG